MKLKVGMLVRTKAGEIGKVISNEMIEFKKDFAKIENLVIGGEITKASHSLLGNDKEPCLIEEGDYVDGQPVKKRKCEDGKEYLGIVTGVIFEEGIVDEFYALEEFIEFQSIVTKEQFSQMEYKVGGVE